MPPTYSLLISDTTLKTWFERDRKHVELRNKLNDKTIVEWWDEAVDDAVDDGFLSTKGFVLGRLIDPRPLHESAYEYAKNCDLLPGKPAPPFGKEA